MKTDSFVTRHVGPQEDDLNSILNVIVVTTIDELIEQTVSAGIRVKEELDLPPSMSEYEYLGHLKNLAKKNKVFRTYIGLGYNESITLSVSKRNILENSGWYTAYTPYQAEIAQG